MTLKKIYNLFKSRAGNSDLSGDDEVIGRLNLAMKDKLEEIGKHNEVLREMEVVKKVLSSQPNGRIYWRVKELLFSFIPRGQDKRENLEGTTKTEPKRDFLYERLRKDIIHDLGVIRKYNPNKDMKKLLENYPTEYLKIYCEEEKAGKY